MYLTTTLTTWYGVVLAMNILRIYFHFSFPGTSREVVSRYHKANDKVEKANISRAKTSRYHSIFGDWRIVSITNVSVPRARNNNFEIYT